MPTHALCLLRHVEKYLESRPLLPWCLLISLTLTGGCSLGSFPQRDPAVVEIPAEGVEAPITVLRGVPFVQVRVNGSEPLWFLVDTGSWACLIDKDVAAALGVKPQMGFGSIVTSAGKQFGRRDLVAFESLAIAGATFGQFEGTVADLSALEAMIAHPFQGVIGSGLIARGVWMIDYAGGTLRLHPASYELPSDERTLPLVWRNMMPTIMIDVGEESFSAELDTGSTSGFEFSRDDAKRLKLDRSIKMQTSHLTLNGVVQEEVVRLDDTVRFGGMSFERPMVNLARDTMIGGEVLRDCVFIIDCARQQVRIVKASQPDGR